MNKQFQIANSLLWASAIIASAALKAPDAMTFLVLPSLAAVSWLFAISRSRSKPCTQRPAGAA